MGRVIRLLDVSSPAKPAMTAPCNGCGYCCAEEVCEVGEALWGSQAPCAGLRWVPADGRFRCGALELADEIGSGEFLRFVLGVGMGCDAEDP